MTSFEIDCPQSFHDCYRLDVRPEHKQTHTEFHLTYNGQLLSIVQTNPEGRWCNTSGKPLTVEELAFVRRQVDQAR